MYYILVGVDISEDYIESWEKKCLDTFKHLYGSEEEAEKALDLTPLEKVIAQSIENWVKENQEGLIDCWAKPRGMV